MGLYFHSTQGKNISNKLSVINKPLTSDQKCKYYTVVGILKCRTQTVKTVFILSQHVHLFFTTSQQ